MKPLALLLLLAAPALAGESLGERPGERSFGGPVSRVTDGDTLVVGERVIRLHGIDAPERDQTCTKADGRDWPCGRRAGKAVERLLLGADLRCEPVGESYGRTVARCWVDVSALVARMGWAVAAEGFTDAYVDDAKAAARRGTGTTLSAMEPPSAHRARPPRRGDPAPPGCTIAGNISASGRIYHMKGQRDYDRTVITFARGERWFCSEDEARAAGWRAARR